jgi:hypothetical protein
MIEVMIRDYCEQAGVVIDEFHPVVGADRTH